MPSLLSALSAHSAIVPETAEIATVRRYGSTHVNLSASHITSAAQLPEHARVVDDAVAWAQKQVGKGGNRKLVAIRAVERLAVEFVQEMLQVVDGQVSVEVDGRLAYKRRPTLERARSIISQLEQLGVDKARVLLKIPATWEGIEAATKLQSSDAVRCHMTLVFGLHQLAACADAGATVISPAVGRITDWHKKKDGVEDYPADQDPGVRAAIAMHDYLAHHGYPTLLMPAMFRSAEQAIALAGSERLSLPMKLLTSLEEQEGGVTAMLTSRVALGPATERLTLDGPAFASMVSADELSASKLASGVRNLSWAVVSQEKQLVDWIGARQDEAAHTSTLALFRIWDYDGDGYIDREEWGGTEEVFNALDRDSNGRISLEEMAIGLGAPYRPEE